MSNQILELSLVSGAAPLGNAGSLFASSRSAPNGPGWFDSSFDLHRGLEVREGWPGDVRLRSWIDSFLGASPAATFTEPTGSSA